MNARQPGTPRRVALLGAESTGKTRLAGELEGRLGAIVVAEYLREFCRIEQRVPRADEQARIIAEQVRRERLAMEAAAARGIDWVVCDTSPVMVALYSLDIFGDASLLGDALGRQRHYDATLVCMPDIPWMPDGIQRVSPQARERIHHMLVEQLQAHGVAWNPVRGIGPERVETALQVLEKIDK